MKHNIFTKLDAFFKARLDQDKVKPADWNTPDDDLLDGVWGALDETKESTSNRKYWILAALLTLITIGAISYHFIRIADLNEQIASLESLSMEQTAVIDNEVASPSYTEITEDQKLTNQPAKIDHRIEKNASSDLEIRENDVNNLSDTKSKRFTKKDISNISSEKQSKSSSVNINGEVSQVAKAVISKPVEFSSEINSTPTNTEVGLGIMTYVDSKSNNRSNGAKAPLSREIVAFETLARLGMPTLPVTERDQQQIETVFAEDNALNIDQKQSNSSVYITAGHLLTSYRMKNIGGREQKLTEYDNLYGGWTAGVGYSKNVTKNTLIDVNLSYKRINNSSNYSDELYYDKDNEYQNADGDIMYDDALRISTTMGSFDDSFVMNMEGATMNQGDVMINTTEIEQSLHIISLSIGIEQLIINKDKFTLGLYGNIGANKITGWSQSMDTKISLNPNKEYDFAYQENDMNKTCSLFIDASVGLRATYHLNQQWSIGISTGLNTSINPINKVVNNTDVKTYIRGFQSNIGLRYHF